MKMLREKSDLDDNGNNVNFTGNDTDLFKLKGEITGETGNNDKKNVEVIVPLKYFSSFWRTLENTLIICEISFMLTWSGNCVISSTITLLLIKKKYLQ